MQRRRRVRILWIAIAGAVVLSAVAIPLWVTADSGPAFTATLYSDVIRFEASGVVSLRVTIYDLAEKELWSSGEVFSGFVDWDRANERGERLANGYYLYLVQGWDSDGRLILDKAGKVVLLPGDQVELRAAPVATIPDTTPWQESPVELGPLAVDVDHSSESWAFGQVGIGTTDPGIYSLNVDGSCYIGGTSGSLVVERTDGSLGASYRAPSGYHTEFQLWEGGSQVGEWQWHGASDYMRFRTIGSYPMHFATDSITALTIDTAQNVGIGTTTPGAYKLRVEGGCYIGGTSGYLVVERTDGSLGAAYKAPSGYHTEFQLWEGGSQVGEWQWHGASDYMRFRTIGSYPMHFATDSITALTIDTAQNVGIGTTGPARKLDVSGTGRFTGALTIGSYTLPTTDGTNGQVLATNGSGTVSWTSAGGSGYWTASGDDIYNSNSGNVGIGTTNATDKVTIEVGSGNAIAVYPDGNRAAGAAVFRVESDGDVYADGTVYSSTTSVGSADVAERINASEWVEAGDVVEIDPEHVGFFRKASGRYSRRVAGIVSTSPGVVLGNDIDPETDRWDDSRPVLAIAGRVPVKVSTENGPIAVGDLLVSSSVSGVAMKGDPAVSIGAVVGKAMETLQSGEGVIMAQVTLR